MSNQDPEKILINNIVPSQIIQEQTNQDPLSSRSEDSNATSVTTNKLAHPGKPSENRIIMEPINEYTNKKEEINTKDHRFPYCIVWSPFPFLSSIFPLFGHIGLGDSRGIINDFSSSYYVSIDEMGFSWPYKYVKLSLDENQKNKWDSTIKKANKHFSKKQFGICDINCHSYVAFVLNKLHYKGRNNYSKCEIMKLIVTKSTYVNKCSIFKVYFWPILFICSIVIIVILICCL